MKGITNYEIREKFEQLESQLIELKNQKTSNWPLTLFSVFAIMAIVATAFYMLYENLLYSFFIVFGLLSMALLLVKIYVDKQQV
jgi:Na+/citrate or Na+/malate symporter